MGLDNGIVIQVPSTELPKELFKLTVDYQWDYKVREETELCYWRKCWGIRDAILTVLDPKGIKQKECEAEYPIEAEDIPAIIRALIPFFKEEYWEEEGDSIWEFDEIFESLTRSVCCLTMLKQYLEEHPDAEVYFYDSY